MRITSFPWDTNIENWFQCIRDRRSLLCHTLENPKEFLVFKDTVAERLVVLLCVIASVLESHTLFTNPLISTEEGRANLLHGEK